MGREGGEGEMHPQLPWIQTRIWNLDWRNCWSCRCAPTLHTQPAPYTPRAAVSRRKRRLGWHTAWRTDTSTRTAELPSAPCQGAPFPVLASPATSVVSPLPLLTKGRYPPIRVQVQLFMVEEKDDDLEPLICPCKRGR